MTLTHSTVAHNGTSLEAGGGIFNSGTLTISNSLIASNVVGEGSGGGLWNSGSATIIDSTLASNLGADSGGGGITNLGILTISNSTLAYNVGIYDPGGIRNFGTLTVTNSTLAYNRARSGSSGTSGGLSNEGGTVALQNTVLALNTLQDPLAPAAPDCGGPVTSLGNNLIGDPTGCTITLLPSDPGLPGEGYFPLLPNSPAIDAGNDAVCSKRDQLGEKRVGPCDIGAIEFQGAAVSSR